MIRLDILAAANLFVIWSFSFLCAAIGMDKNRRENIGVRLLLYDDENPGVDLMRNSFFQRFSNKKKMVSFKQSKKPV